MDNLRDYQRKAARIIYDFFNSNETKAKIYLSTGLGRNTIIVSSVQLILQNKNVSVAILSPKRVLCEQLRAAFADSFVNNEFVNNRVAMHLHEFLILLLKKYGFDNILQEVKLGNKNSNSYRADIVAKKGTKDVVVEVKLYRNLYVSQTIISNALNISAQRGRTEK